MSKVVLLFLLFVLASNQALACTVCVTGKEEARFAYYFTTGLLSLLPLAMIGGIIFTVIKKSK
ncbi:MAG: hypothetical protein AAGB46_10165 [Verrucomicrobiota bacterium]